MPLPGGEADKIGNRYEKRWTTRKIIDILKEDAIKMFIEPLGEDEKKAEFWIEYKNGKREYHQVKRQRASKDNWTISSLKEVLLAAYDHLIKDENFYFVFISQTPCGVMREIGDRIASSNSVLEFFNYFFTNNELKDGVIKLANIWDIKIPEKLFKDEGINISEEISNNGNEYKKLYNILKRIDFRTEDTTSLKENNEALMKNLVTGNDSVNAIFSFIDDHIHKKIVVSDVWKYLNEKGYQRINYSGDNRVANKIETLQSKFENSIKNNLINNTLIYRKEAKKIMDIFAEKDDNLILLNGKAGSGKSSVLFQFVKILEEKGISYLPLRLDRQLPDYNSSEKFGESLDLPNSPEITINNFTGNDTSVLIIDQLDSIRWTSYNYTQAWECIAEMINRGLNYSNLFIVVSCRSYDLNNDPLISAWKGNNSFKEIKIKSLKREEIQVELKKVDVQLDKLSDIQMNLLKNPLNLFLFTEIIKEREYMKFDASIDLFKEYYKIKLNTFNNSRLDFNAGEEILKKIVNKFDENQQLSIKKQFIQGNPEIIDALISLNILDEYQKEETNDNVISFFHQEFFDYLFARFFIQQDKDIFNWLIEKEQSLFRREQLSQLLIFKRNSAQRGKHLEVINKILKSDEIRFHLKQVTLHQFSNFDSLLDKEVDYVIDLIKEDDWKEHIIYEVIYNNDDWFVKLYNRDFFHQSLTEEKHLSKSELINTFGIYLEDYPAKVVELLSLYLDHFEWTNRFEALISRNSITFNNEYFNWLLSAISEGQLDDYQFYINPAEENIEMLLEFVGIWLKRQVDIAEEKLKESEQIRYPNLFDNRDGINHEVFNKLAESDPEKFINTILPRIMSLIKITITDDREIPKYDEFLAPNISLRINSESMHIVSITDLLIETLEISFEKLAAENPEDFKILFDEYKKSTYLVIQYFLLRGLANCNNELAYEAIKYIINKIKEFKQIGIKSRNGWNSEMIWVARGVIKNNASEVSDDMSQQLFEVLNGYYTSNDIFSIKSRHKKFQNKSPKKWNLNVNNFLFKSEYYLLSALPAEKRNKKIEKRILELKRKFGEVSPPVSFESGFVGSPIEWEALEQMSDADCLSAIKRYKNLNDKSTQDLKGGALELSRNFEKLAHKNGKRFANLIFEFPKNSYPGYFSSVLVGITKSKHSPFDEGNSSIKASAQATFDQICSVIDYLYNNFKAPQVLKAINRVVRENNDQDWPNNTLDILKENLKSDYNEERRVQSEINNGRDILTEGINIVSGTAADAIGSILFSQPDKYKFFRSAIINALNSSVIYTRSLVVKSCLAVYNIDKDEAMNLFDLLLNIDDKRIFATRHARKFLDYITINNYDKYKGLIDELLTSSYSEVEQFASSLKLRKLLTDKGKEEVMSFINGSEINSRLGIVKFLNDSFIKGKYLSVVKEALIIMFDDPSPEIRKEAIDIFRKINSESQKRYSKVLMPAIKSKSFEDNPAIILRAMTKFNNYKNIEEEIFAVVNIINSKKRSIETYRNKFSIYKNDIIKLILSIYHNAIGDSRIRCLDALDILSEIRFINSIAELDKVERKI